MNRAMFRLAAILVVGTLVIGASSALGAAKRGGKPAPAAVKAAKPHGAKHPHKAHKPQRGNLGVAVVSQRGQPVAGAKVHLHKVVPHKHRTVQAVPRGQHAAVVARAGGGKRGHRPPHHAGRVAVTDARGQAVFLHVRAGHYRVVAHQKGVGTGAAHAAVRGGQNSGVTVRLAHPHHRAQAARLPGAAVQRRHAFVAPHPPAARKR